MPADGSQIAQDVLEQMEMIFHNVSKNVMQAHIKNKAYSDKKTNALKLKQHIMFCLTAEKISSTKQFSLSRFSLDWTLQY